MNKTIVLLSLLLSLCLVVIAGCGGGDPTSEVPDGAENPETTYVEWTCTAPDPGVGNPHAGARIRSVGSDLDGIRANIMCEYGKLCCLTECYSVEEFSVTYIALVRDNDLGLNGQSHIACGYGTMTLANEPVYECLYVENIGNYSSDPCDYRMWTFGILDGIPPEGEQHKLQLRFNRTEVKWEALYDDTVFCDRLLNVRCSTSDTLWKYAKGEWVEMLGEISALESDMPGTWSYRVKIFDWEIRKSGSDSTDWDTVNYVASLDDTVSTDTWEWRAYVEDVTVDTLYIYDKDPL